MWDYELGFFGVWVYRGYLVFFLLFYDGDRWCWGVRLFFIMFFVLAGFWGFGGLELGIWGYFELIGL